jgi:hypothetical protein
VAWRQDDAGNLTLQAASYDGGSGWAPAERVADGPVNLLSIAASAPGEAVLAWSSGLAGGESVYASSLAAASWSAAALVEATGHRHGQLFVRANALGAAVAVWTTVTTDHTVRAAVLDGGWGGAATLENLTADTWVTQPGIDAGGDAVVLWMGTVNTYFPTAMAKHYVNGTGWLASQSIAGGYDRPTDVAVAADGSASAAVGHFDGTNLRPFEARYLPVAAPPTPLEARVAALEAQLNLSIAALGASLAALEAVVDASAAPDAALWQQLNATRDALAALEGNVSALRSTVTAQGEGGAAAAARLAALEQDVVEARADLNATAAEAAAAGTVAARAEAQGSSAGTALAAGIAGAALGAAGVALALRPRGEGLGVKEKGSRTKSQEAGGPGAEADSDELRVKEKGNRTKSLEAGGPGAEADSDELRVKEKGNRTK